jgi:ubiquinone/menaquinone biosynthesis C-methylase UbiE
VLPVRDPLGLNERLFAFYYPIVCGISERAGQRETRRELIGQASGRTLEVGAGSGLNLPHYTAAVTALVVTEPSPHMRAHLSRQLEADPPPVGSWELIDGGGEDLPFEDESFDTITATFVHCTIPDPRRALAEFARVLRPGGRYLFLEHVHAGEGTALGRFQDLVEVPHRYIAAGCYPNRRTEALLAESPFEIERLEHSKQPRSFPTVRPTIIGSARRATPPAPER